MLIRLAVLLQHSQKRDTCTCVHIIFTSKGVELFFPALLRSAKSTPLGFVLTASIRKTSHWLVRFGSVALKMTAAVSTEPAMNLIRVLAGSLNVIGLKCGTSAEIRHKMRRKEMLQIHKSVRNVVLCGHSDVYTNGVCVLLVNIV